MEPDSKNWWSSLPGVITAIAGTLTAMTGLIIALNQIGFFKSDNKANDNRLETSPPKQPSTDSTTATTSTPPKSEVVIEDWGNSSPKEITGLLQALGKMGVDFSVPENELRDWLADPDTPYPAISKALLHLGRRLRRPVYLDDIAWNYEHTPHVASPRKGTDVKLDILKAAIVKGSNVRYGTNITDFDQLLVP